MFASPQPPATLDPKLYQFHHHQHIQQEQHPHLVEFLWEQQFGFTRVHEWEKPPLEAHYLHQ